MWEPRAEEESPGPHEDQLPHETRALRSLQQTRTLPTDDGLFCYYHESQGVYTHKGKCILTTRKRAARWPDCVPDNMQACLVQLPSTVIHVYSGGSTKLPHVLYYNILPGC